MDLAAIFGENVKRHRLRRGLTIEALAHDARLSYSYVGEVERGLRNPTLRIIGALSTALEIETATLFTSN